MYWEGPQIERPNLRPYALHRNGYAGIQRYCWLWSGDIDSTWKTLEAQVPVGANSGLSGVPFWSTDTGGFVTTKELTGELYVRGLSPRCNGLLDRMTQESEVTSIDGGRIDGHS